MLRVSSLLGSKYKMIAEPPAPAAAAPVGVDTVVRPKSGASAPTTPATTTAGAEKTEEDFVELAGNEDADPTSRQKAIQDLRELASKPVPQSQKGGSLEEVESRGARLANAVKRAEEAASIADENNLYRNAWSESKAKIGEALSTMAEASGYTPEQIASSIKSGGAGGVRFNVDGKRLTPKEWLESLVGGKFYESAAPFKQWANTSLGGQMGGKLAAEPWGRVFEAYMGEKTDPTETPAQDDEVVPATEWKPGQSVSVADGVITRTK